jgi:pSer/pThr/pTyr-binding forkhead associated (FHA) protein
MKVSLVVMDGAHKGKEIPIKSPQFIIGRDPQCQLRPASPMISRKHCALVAREGKIFLHDFGSTNGTQVNDQRVNGEVELHNEDRIKVDPLVFQIRIATPAPDAKATPPPPTKVVVESGDDDSIAAMLLELQDDSTDAVNAGAVLAEVPMGETVMQMPAPDTAADTKAEKPKGKADEKKLEQANTAAAAKMLLDKYTRRKRV